MLNTSAPLYADNRFEKEMKKQEAELYARLYPMAAEDFTSHPDVKKFATEVAACFEKMQQQLSNLFNIVSSHTHIVPPHTHPLEPHTHVSNGPGAPTTPNLGSFSTLPMQLTTNPPSESSSLQWASTPNPNFINTTGSIPNMEGNRIIVGPSATGPLITGKRRMKVDPALNAVTFLPIIKGLKSL